jgi:NAD(P)-dependent dehydrogenase (short-subunit alcohol dehydrogenase family)
MAELDGKVALVTGSGSGIGRATAVAYARAGARVVVSDINQDGAEETLKQIQAAGGQVIVAHADVSKPEDCQALVDRALKAFGRLDYACNNAGIAGEQAPTAELSLEGWAHVLATNLSSVFYCMKYEIPAMLASGGGAIVNMASIAGLNATANLAAYVAGKAGIIGLTKVAALDYADQGIRVNVVAPGPIRTYHIEAAGEQAIRAASMSTPMRRMGTAAEVAQTVLWLCSDQASFITGTVIPVDGGQAAGNKPPQMYRQGQPMKESPAAS